MDKISSFVDGPVKFRFQRLTRRGGNSGEYRSSFIFASLLCFASHPARASHPQAKQSNFDWMGFALATGFLLVSVREEQASWTAFPSSFLFLLLLFVP
jgi:hypothetical protein